MDRKTRIPITIILTILTRRDWLTRTAPPDRPTKMNRLERPAKMTRLNWPYGYKINDTAADGRRRKKNTTPTREFLKLRLLFAILPIPWRPVGFRGAVRGGPIKAQRGVAKYTKPKRTDGEERGAKEWASNLQGDAK